MNVEGRTEALDLLQREALLLDEQRWSEWLSLYADDCTFWVPMWKSEAQATSDPATELSFIFMQGVAQLEERVRRATSGRAVSSMPIPRTTHLVGPGLICKDDSAPVLEVRSAFRSQAYLHKGNQCVDYLGRYTHELVMQDGLYRIRRKTIHLNSDYLQSKLDFFYI